MDANPAADPVTGASPGEPRPEDREAEPAPSRLRGVDEVRTEGSPGGGGRKGRRQSVGGFLRELPVLIVVAFLVALLVKTFLVQAFYIPSPSMEPTLMVGDRVLVNKVVYHLHPPRRGDVIVFGDPNPPPDQHRSVLSAFWHWLTEGFGVQTGPEKDFIKRVVGLPGEVVEVHRGVVYIDGRPLDEPYLPHPLQDLSDSPPTTVPRNSLFVMGDNRANSFDSRRGLGFIPFDRVVGRAVLIVWPPSQMRWLGGPSPSFLPRSATSPGVVPAALPAPAPRGARAPAA
jgi:signal peptidase I